MKKCFNCGAQIADDSQFCTECGKQIPQGNVCSHCGASVNNGDVFCQTCGNKVDGQQLPSTVSSKQKHCPHCGIEVSEGDLFCERCGAKIDNVLSASATESLQNVCPHCGLSMNNGDVFCQNCGGNISGGSITTANTSNQIPYTTESWSQYKLILPIAIGLLVLALAGGGWWYYTHSKRFSSEKQVSVIKNVPTTSEDYEETIEDKYEPKADDFDVQSFILGYYDAIVNGDYISYFEDDDITFFSLKHVSRDEVVKAFNETKKYNTDINFDWSTLDVTISSSGSMIAVYSFDYYIHYQSRTDQYRITSEMIISPNRKIRSIRDIETIKIGSDID